MRIFVALMVVAALASANGAEITGKKDTFPSIIEHLKGTDSIRFLSKIRWFEGGEEIPVETKLLDEAFSIKHNSGRMIVYKQGVLNEEIKDLSLFVWSSQPKNIAEQLNATTMCASVIKTTPVDAGLLFPLECLKDMLEFTETPAKVLGETKPIKLFGVSAILANIIEHHADKLVRLDNTKDTDTHIDFLLDTGCDCMIKVRFAKTEGVSMVDKKLTIRDIVGLTVYKAIKGADSNTMERGPKIARLNVLKIQDKIDEDILALPEGYVCHNGMIARIRSPRITRSAAMESKSEFESRFPFDVQVDGWRTLDGSLASDSDEHLLNDDVISTIDPSRRGLHSCMGLRSCLGYNSGWGLQSCAGTGSCSGQHSGSGERSCGGRYSCSGRESGRGSTSCSGTGSCSGENSGHCPNSCSLPNSCTAPNSCY